MLRELFNLPPRHNDGELQQTMEEIRQFARRLERSPAQAQGRRQWSHFSIWSLGFLDSLDELEQSLFCAEWLAERIRSDHVDGMTEQELTDYRRFVYFYKNALIRIFSTLDKLGYFLNEWYELGTEKVKLRFSYFTVLRVMHEHHQVPVLQQQLYEIKTAHKEPLQDLRNQRNMEIHFVNADLLDDWMGSTYRPGGQLHVENVREQSAKLRQGYEMTRQTLLAVYRYLNRPGEGKRG